MGRSSIKTAGFLRKVFEAFVAFGSEKLFDKVNMGHRLSEPTHVLCVVATVDEIGWSSFLPARALRRGVWVVETAMVCRKIAVTRSCCN